MSYRDQKSATRSIGYKSATALCVFNFTLLANIAFAAEPKVVIDGILGDAIPAIQRQMTSMSLGCGGGPNGRPPHSWGALQGKGHAAVNAFSEARTSLARDQTQVAVQKINAGLVEYDGLVNGLERNCPGDRSGVNPQSYGAWVTFRNNLKTELQTALRFM